MWHRVMSSNMQRLRRNSGFTGSLLDIEEDPELQDDLEDTDRDLQQAHSRPHGPLQQAAAAGAAAAAAAGRHMQARAEQHAAGAAAATAAAAAASAAAAAAAAGQPLSAPDLQHAPEGAADQEAGNADAPTGELTQYGRASKYAGAKLSRLLEHIDKKVAEIGDLYAAVQGDKRIINNGRAVGGFFLQLPVRYKKALVLTFTEGSCVSEAAACDMTASLTACAQLARTEARRQEDVQELRQVTAVVSSRATSCAAPASGRRPMGGMPATAAGVGAAAAGGAVGSHADRQGQRSRVGGNSSSSTQGPARGLGGVSSGAEDGDDDTEPVERSVEQLAEMEPSKLKQHTARLIQRTLGGEMPAAAGLCNGGRHAAAAVRRGWKVVDGRCACGGSCAAGRASLNLPADAPLIRFGRRSAPSSMYSRWISWAQEQVQQRGPDWLGGRLQAVLSKYEQAHALHDASLTSRRQERQRVRSQLAGSLPPSVLGGGADVVGGSAAAGSPPPAEPLAMAAATATAAAAAAAAPAMAAAAATEMPGAAAGNASGAAAAAAVAATAPVAEASAAAAAGQQTTAAPPPPLAAAAASGSVPGTGAVLLPLFVPAAVANAGGPPPLADGGSRRRRAPSARRQFDLAASDAEGDAAAEAPSNGESSDRADRDSDGGQSEPGGRRARKRGRAGRAASSRGGRGRGGRRRATNAAAHVAAVQKAPSLLSPTLTARRPPLAAGSLECDEDNPWMQAPKRQRSGGGGRPQQHHSAAVTGAGGAPQPRQQQQQVRQQTRQRLAPPQRDQQHPQPQHRAAATPAVARAATAGVGAGSGVLRQPSPGVSPHLGPAAAAASGRPPPSPTLDLPSQELGDNEEWQRDAERQQLDKQREEQQARLQQMSAKELSTYLNADVNPLVRRAVKAGHAAAATRPEGPPPPSFCSMGPAGRGGQPAAQTGFSAFPLSWIWGSHRSGRE